MPEIIVKDPSSVTVDGKSFGAVADTIANNPNLAADIQRALDKWHDDMTKTNAATHAAAVENMRLSGDAALAKVNAEMAEMEAKHRAAQKAARANASELTAALEARDKAITKITAAANAREVDTDVVVKETVADLNRPAREKEISELEARLANLREQQAE
jgi:aspartate aminotransferase-like enzyme